MCSTPRPHCFPTVKAQRQAAAPVQPTMAIRAESAFLRGKHGVPAEAPNVSLPERHFRARKRQRQPHSRLLPISKSHPNEHSDQTQQVRALRKRRPPPLPPHSATAWRGLRAARLPSLTGGRPCNQLPGNSTSCFRASQWPSVTAGRGMAALQSQAKVHEPKELRGHKPQLRATTPVTHTPLPATSSPKPDSISRENRTQTRKI